MINIFKKGYKTLESDIDTYIVQWWSRYGNFSGEIKRNYQAFTNLDEANEFAESLRKAFELIGTTCENKVTVTKQKRNIIH